MTIKVWWEEKVFLKIFKNNFRMESAQYLKVKKPVHFIKPAVSKRWRNSRLDL